MALPGAFILLPGWNFTFNLVLLRPEKFDGQGLSKAGYFQAAEPRYFKSCLPAGSNFKP
jgi:hypothetical protein